LLTSGRTRWKAFARNSGSFSSGMPFEQIGQRGGDAAGRGTRRRRRNHPPRPAPPRQTPATPAAPRSPCARSAPATPLLRSSGNWRGRRRARPEAIARPPKPGRARAGPSNSGGAVAFRSFARSKQGHRTVGIRQARARHQLLEHGGGAGQLLEFGGLQAPHQEGLAGRVVGGQQAPFGERLPPERLQLPQGLLEGVVEVVVRGKLRTPRGPPPPPRRCGRNWRRAPPPTGRADGSSEAMVRNNPSASGIAVAPVAQHPAGRGAGPGLGRRSIRFSRSG
jgi:hypothetical protein